MFAYLRGLALRVAADKSAASLLACNILAIVFAFFNPPVSVAVMFLYWAECAVIGVLNFIKLYYVLPAGIDPDEFARKSPGDRAWIKNFAAGFFVLHYGLFLFMLFSLLYAIGEHEMQGKGVRHYDIAGHLAGFWFPVLLIGSGHVHSFFRNFLGKREYTGRSFEDQMFRPYKRTALMMAVMFGAVAAIIIIGMPGIGLFFFIPFMLIASLEAHFREHKA